MHWPYPRVLAHRGGGTVAPENTLAAIRVGFEAGFRGIECDAMLAADGVPVLIHDWSLERTTNGRGEVAALTAAELARLDAGTWLAPRFAGEPVPSLAQAIATCRALGSWMNIEIKPSPGCDRETGTTVALAAARGYAGAAALAPLLSSFSYEALAAARAAAPALVRGRLYGEVPARWQEELEALDARALHCDHRHLTAALVDAVKDAGYWVFCYTVNDPARVAELFTWGVDGLCTDRIDLVNPNAASG